MLCSSTKLLSRIYKKNIRVTHSFKFTLENRKSPKIDYFKKLYRVVTSTSCLHIFKKKKNICLIVQKLLKRQFQYWANCVSWRWFLSVFSSASFMKLAIQRTPGLPKFPWLLQMVCLSVLGSSLSLTASTGSSTGGAVVVVGNSSSLRLSLSLYHLRSRGPLSFIFSLSLSSFSICKMQWQLSPEELAGLQPTQLLLP